VIRDESAVKPFDIDSLIAKHQLFLNAYPKLAALVTATKSL
jgi:hypothetical protein